MQPKLTKGRNEGFVVLARPKILVGPKVDKRHPRFAGPMLNPPLQLQYSACMPSLPHFRVGGKGMHRLETGGLQERRQQNGQTGNPSRDPPTHGAVEFDIFPLPKTALRSPSLLFMRSDRKRAARSPSRCCGGISQLSSALLHQPFLGPMACGMFDDSSQIGAKAQIIGIVRNHEVVHIKNLLSGTGASAGKGALRFYR